MSHDENASTGPGPTAEPRTDSQPGSAPDPQPDSGGPWAPSGPGPGEHPKRDRTRAKSSNRPLLLAVGGGIVALGLLIWLLVSLFGTSDERNLVDPSSISDGECLADFTAITEEAALVDCSEAHNAQLLASDAYAEDAEFPGRDELGERAEAACDTASDAINGDVLTEDTEVTLLRTTPTEGTWADGDRRIDCFAVVGNGETLSQSLLNP